MVSLLQCASLAVQKEAAWVLGNIATHGAETEIRHLVECDCIKPIVDALGNFDSDTSQVLLNTIEKIVKVGEDLQQDGALPTNPYATMLQQASGRQKLETLTANASPGIRELTFKILSSC